MHEHATGPTAIPGLADLLEPPADEFAFADTVQVRAFLDDVGRPPGRPIIVHDPDAGTLSRMTPLSSPARVALDGETDLWARARRAVHASVAELRELWSETSDVLDEEDIPVPDLSAVRTPSVLRRMRALWSLWQWEEVDVFRATAIGLTVFLVTATVGTLALGRENARTAHHGLDDANAPHAGRGLDPHAAPVDVAAGRAR